MSVRQVLVVGGGLAGAETVRALRAGGFSGRVVLLCEERELPYDRPPLSKAVLSGTQDTSTLDLDWAGLEVDLRLGTAATGLRAGAVETDAGDVAYDRAVIATGSVPVRLPGAAGGRALRTAQDARAVRAALRPGARLVVVGAGWIGAEVATAAAGAGARVTVLEALTEPLAGALPAHLGARTRPWWAEAGVDLRTGVRAQEVEPDGVTLADGTAVAADAVVVGVGVRPATGWLRGSGVALDAHGGVLVDAGQRASVPGVFAVGDCAAWPSSRYGRRLRVEHWDTALHAPGVAAANALGGDTAYDPVPYFWSEQFGRTLQAVGLPAAAQRWVTRAEGPTWAAFGLAGSPPEERLVAAVAVDRPRDAVQARRLMAAAAGPGPVVDPLVLADPAAAVKTAQRVWQA
jgi:3-phenylpropionate/trans-cinnamate dioxygenase ferredoxin reductase component